MYNFPPICRLVETHIFSFVIGRAFVTDIEKLKIHNKEKSLHIGKVMDFFSELTKVAYPFFLIKSNESISLCWSVSPHKKTVVSLQDGINPGSNFLYAVEVLVSGVCLRCFSTISILLNILFIIFAMLHYYFECIHVLLLLLHNIIEKIVQTLNVNIVVICAYYFLI